MVNTCPKARRPINGKCEDGFYSKPNKQGFDCCYKITRKPKTSSKPKSPKPEKKKPSPKPEPKKTSPPKQQQKPKQPSPPKQQKKPSPPKQQKKPSPPKNPFKNAFYPKKTTGQLYILMNQVSGIINTKAITVTMEQSKYYFDKPENINDVQEMYAILVNVILKYNSNKDVEMAKKNVKKAFLDYIKHKQLHK